MFNLVFGKNHESHEAPAEDDSDCEQCAALEVELESKKKLCDELQTKVANLERELAQASMKKNNEAEEHEKRKRKLDECEAELRRCKRTILAAGVQQRE